MVSRYSGPELRRDGNEIEVLVIEGIRVVFWPYSSDENSCIAFGRDDLEREYVERGGNHMARDHKADLSDFNWKSLVVAADISADMKEERDKIG